MQIKREFYLQQLIDGKQNGLIKIVTGIRRCGKSFLLFKLFKQHLLKAGVDAEHIIQIALDDIENADLREPLTLYKCIKAKMKDDDLYYILLDEVQLVPRFEDVLNSLLRIDNADVYVTGSNSKFLSSDIITEFRGRGDEIHLYPLSLSEYCEGTGLSPAEAWKDYYTYGGLPHILTLETEKKKFDYLDNLFESVYLIDILERQRIKNKAEFEELVKIIASGIGAPTNPAKLANTFKSVKNVNIDPTTINRYLGYMQDAFLIEKSERYDVKGKKYIGSLSAYCGAVSAGCGAGAAITYLSGGSYEDVSLTIVNTIGNVGGIVCDGAKSSCAAKIASAVDAAILAHYMGQHHRSFQPGEGIVREDVEDTIKSMGYIGRVGMKDTDTEILNIMIDRVDIDEVCK